MDLIAEHNHKMKVFHDIVGCAMDVYKEYRHGLTEYPYQYGLTHLLDKLGYDVQKEYPLPLYLFGEKLKEHYVERYDTRYMGMMYEKTVKPWQSYLDEKRKTRSLYYHHITLKKK